MHPATHAKTHPDRAAYIMAGSGETVTYRQLDERSNQGAQLLQVRVAEPDAPLRHVLPDAGRVVGSVDADAVPLAQVMAERSEDEEEQEGGEAPLAGARELPEGHDGAGQMEGDELFDHREATSTRAS